MVHGVYKPTYCYKGPPSAIVLNVYIYVIHAIYGKLQLLYILLYHYYYCIINIIIIIINYIYILLWLQSMAAHMLCKWIPSL
jgi:hypothetical protein